MRKLILLGLCLSMVSCANARFAANDTQCKRNNAVDGVAIATFIALPISVVGPAAVAVGAGVMSGGSYFITHEAICR